ncbi:acyl-CoA N-acyltransferase [Annulohypoxylon maeteangense]|uniref:acyl-CoA N-acyltransferase n=1 Tax=Annulohypoxylon maeteangense TaxID=1927788 RepID=UPI0020075375|nr:acyl-CoA N-acyltransferase [Annulohypoxylon maeteangense]KAI0888652.1 acyl-CoA N-acyltransferase [Annulohypoxylon maeteangense]
MSHTPPDSPARKDAKPVDESREESDSDSDSDDPFRHTRPTLGLGGLMSTFSRGNLHSYKEGAQVEERENAVDDSEDMPESDAAEAKGTGNYGRRSQLHSRGGDGDPKLRRLKEIMPLPFHPNVRPLTVSDLESCVALEEAAFEDPKHRCTREKFEYRLSVCPELCLGLFCTIVPDKARAEGFEISTLPVAKPVETGRSDGAKSVLVAHIVATRTQSMVVTDESMDYPRDFRTNKQHTLPIGHQETGQTVCIHSLAIHPKFQGCHLGKMIMLAYLQQLKGSETARFCSLICQDYLVPFYKRFDFRHMGPSEAQFGGGGWQDMVVCVDELPIYGGKRPQRSK